MKKSTILYITRNGALEPLGQSQVIAYLKGVSKRHHVTLVSFEKPEDRANVHAVENIKKECANYGIRWLPQKFHYSPKLIAPVWSMLIFFLLCLIEVCRGRADLIHARSYVPAAVALLIWKITGTPFVFDMRALWPEELITAGRLKRGSVVYRILIWIERKCLKHAAAVVCLTHASVLYLKDTYPAELTNQTIKVIPTCADLNRFAPLAGFNRSASPVYSCVGTVLSGWFYIDWLSKFFQVVAKNNPDVRFEIITRDPPDNVKAEILKGDGYALQNRLQVFGLPPQDVHSYVQKHTVSVMFFSQGVSKLGSSPTRLGEILGCGLPVVANSGVGDVAHIINKYNVGVLVSNGSDEAMEIAYKNLEQLLMDADLPTRCRKAAEDIFSLQSGTRKYLDIYRQIIK